MTSSATKHISTPLGPQFSTRVNNGAKMDFQDERMILAARLFYGSTYVGFFVGPNVGFFVGPNVGCIVGVLVGVQLLLASSFTVTLNSDVYAVVPFMFTPVTLSV